MFLRPRRTTSSPPYTLFFKRRGLPPPPPIFPPMQPVLPRRFATPPLPSRKIPGPGPGHSPLGPSPQTPIPSNSIWNRKFIAKLCVLLSVEVFVAQSLRLKVAEDQERSVAASELARLERHDVIAAKLQKLIEFEEEKKKERVSEKGKTIVKDPGTQDCRIRRP